MAKKYVRNATATALGLVLISGLAYVGQTTYRGQTVDVYDCDDATRGVRFFYDEKDADGRPVVPALADRECTLFTPKSFTGGSGKAWHLWACICKGAECCQALDHPRYIGADAADLKAFAKSLDGISVTKADLLCAVDPQGCTSDGQPAPCRRVVSDIPVERRPAEAEWFQCNVWAGFGE